MADRIILSAIEKKVLAKLSLSLEDIFKPRREDAKEDLDAVSYIGIKGYLDTDNGQEVLSVSIYEATNKIGFYVYNKSTEKRRQTTSADFKILLATLTEYATEDIDSI